MKKLNQKGFSVVDTLVVGAIIVLLVLIGMKVNKDSSSKASESSAAKTSTAQTTSSNATTVPTITNKADLDKMSKALDDSDTTTQNTSDDSALSSQSGDY